MDGIDDGWMDKWGYRQIDRWMDRCLGEWIDGLMDGSFSTMD